MGDPNPTLDLIPSTTSVYGGSSGTTARDVAAIFFRRKKIIFLLFFAVLAGATLGVTWLASYLAPPRFISGLKFIIKKDRVDALVTPADRSVPGLTTVVSAQEVYSEIELLKSADVLERLADDLDRTRPGLLERLGSDLVVEPVTAGRNVTNLIAVRYSSTDPEEVRGILRKLPEVYLEKHLSMTRRPAAQEYFRTQAEASEQQLRQAEEELAAFGKRQGAGGEARRLDLGRKLAESEKHLAEAEASIREAESRAGELRRQFEALPAAVSAPAVPGADPLVQQLRTQRVELEARRSQATFYREIEQIDRRIDELRQAMAREKEAKGAPPPGQPNPLRAATEAEILRNEVLLAGLRARHATVLDQQRSNRHQIDVFTRLAAGDAALSATLARNVKMAEENFFLYRKKYAEAREAEALDQKGVLNVALAEAPRPPVPVPGRRLWLYLTTSAVLAAGVALTAGFAVDRLDHSIHTPRELEQCCSVSVLACVPNTKQA